MTLKEFALLAGVRVERCHDEWGGTWAYKIKDNPRATFCGYRSEAHVYESWANETFGASTHKAILKLLADSQKRA